MICSGFVGHWPRHSLRPALSTTQMAVIFCETSNPTKWVIDQPPTARITRRHRPDRGTIDKSSANRDYAVEGAEDQVGRASELVRQHGVNAADVIIAVAASGTMPFTVSCLREAKQVGALTIGLANNRDTPLLQEADHSIFLDTGPEPIAGSNSDESRNGPSGLR